MRPFVSPFYFDVLLDNVLGSEYRAGREYCHKSPIQNLMLRASFDVKNRNASKSRPIYKMIENVGKMRVG